MSKVNDTPPIGPHYARPKPVEAHSKQAGDHSRGQAQDVLNLHGGPGIVTRRVPLGRSGGSSAYLIVLVLAIALVVAVTGWAGPEGLVGVGIGWLTGLLLWAIRKDLARVVSDLFE